MNDIEKEAREDIEFLNSVKIEIIESAYLGNQSLSETTRKIGEILSKMSNVRPEQEEFLKVFNDALPDIQNLLDVKDIASFDLGLQIKKIVSGEMSKSDIETLLKIRNDLRKYQSFLLNIVANATSKAGLDLPSMLREFLNFIPPEGFEKQRGSVERLSETLSRLPKGDRAIEADNLNHANHPFIQASQVISIYLKWIDYEFDTLLQPQVMPLSDIRQISDGAGKVLDFLNKNPSIIQIAGLFLLIINLILSH